MKWNKVPLKKVAPSVPAEVKLSDNRQVWLLTLDQIESNTGRIIDKKAGLPSQAGSSTNVFDEKNVLYSKLRPYLNKVVCPNEQGIATSELIPLRPVEGVLERRYLTYYLRSSHFLNFAKLAVAGVKMPRIIMAKFWKHEIPLPPYSEQSRIAGILDQAEALRNKCTDAEAQTNQLLYAVFNDLFGDPVLNDRGWSWTTIGEVAADVRNGTNPKKEDFGSGIPFVTVNNLYGGLAIDIEHLSRVQVSRSVGERYRLLRGDICIVRSSVKRKGVGMASMFDSDEHVVFGGFVIRIRPNEDVVPSFLCAMLLHPSMRARIVASAGTGTITNISQPSLKRIKMINPPYDLQKQFEQRVLMLKQLQPFSYRRGVKLQRLFETLTHEAFTGALTAKWHEAHTKELLKEMEQQSKVLDNVSAKARKTTFGTKKRHAGHDMFNKAALAAYITDRCHSSDHPMGRVKLAKLFYLVQKRAEIQLTEVFTKRAAGPLDDEIHKFLNLARKNKWLIFGRAQGDLKPVKPGTEVSKAQAQARKVLGTAIDSVDDMLDQMKDWSYKTLERWATVLEVAMELHKTDTKVSVKAIKSAVLSQPQWATKLDRAEFSDEHITATLKGLRKQGLLAENA